MHPCCSEYADSWWGLLQYLKSQNLYEKAEETEQREEVLGLLSMIVKDWNRKVQQAVFGYDWKTVEGQAKIFTFGSFRLGVHGPGRWTGAPGC
jgi:poly(A) polymerase